MEFWGTILKGVLLSRGHYYSVSTVIEAADQLTIESIRPISKVGRDEGFPIELIVARRLGDLLDRTGSTIEVVCQGW